MNHIQHLTINIKYNKFNLTQNQPTRDKHAICAMPALEFLLKKILPLLYLHKTLVKDFT